MTLYRVLGRRGTRVLRHTPGEEFEADLPAAQERRLLAGGFLELVEPHRSRPRKGPPRNAQLPRVEPEQKRAEARTPQPSDPEQEGATDG